MTAEKLSNAIAEAAETRAVSGINRKRQASRLRWRPTSVWYTALVLLALMMTGLSATAKEEKNLQATETPSFQKQKENEKSQKNKNLSIEKIDVDHVKTPNISNIDTSSMISYDFNNNKNKYNLEKNIEYEVESTSKPFDIETELYKVYSSHPQALYTVDSRETYYKNIKERDRKDVEEKTPVMYTRYRDTFMDTATNKKTDKISDNYFTNERSEEKYQTTSNYETSFAESQSNLQAEMYEIEDGDTLVDGLGNILIFLGDSSNENETTAETQGKIEISQVNTEEESSTSIDFTSYNLSTKNKSNFGISRPVKNANTSQPLVFSNSKNKIYGIPKHDRKLRTHNDQNIQSGTISTMPDIFTPRGTNSRKTKENKIFKKNAEHEDMDYQGDMPFERLPRLEIIADEILSELSVKQILECNLPSNATMTSWYKDGKLMLSSPVESAPFPVDLVIYKGSDLVIPRVAKEHDGSYTCRGQDKDGGIIDGQPIKLIVLETPSTPEFLISGNPIPDSGVITFKEGVILNATCRVVGGRPAPRLSFVLQRQGFQVFAKHAPDIDIENVNVSNGAYSTASLLLRRPHHNSTLNCVTTHPTLASSVYTSVKLNIEYTPRFAISRFPGFGIPLAEGAYAFLRCEVDSNPPANPIWLKDDKEPPVSQTEDGYLNFTSLRRDHSGWYKCTANHTTGVFSSIGYFFNVRYENSEVTREPDDGEKPTEGIVEVALGGDIQLQCPTGSVGCWGHLSGGEWSGAGATAPHGALSLRGLLYQQAGSYRCEGMSAATRGRLEVLREATVVVTGGPTVFPPNRTVLVAEGESAIFSAEFCANPPATRVLWISADRIIRLGEYAGQIVAHNATNSSSQDCNIATLKIESASLQHSGEYSLLARNSQGSTEAVFLLAVTGSRKVSKTSEGNIIDWLASIGSFGNCRAISKSVLVMSFTAVGLIRQMTLSIS